MPRHLFATYLTDPLSNVARLAHALQRSQVNNKHSIVVALRMSSVGGLCSKETEVRLSQDAEGQAPAQGMGSGTSLIEPFKASLTAGRKSSNATNCTGGAEPLRT